jgi:hypothetical protein
VVWSFCTVSGRVGCGPVRSGQEVIDAQEREGEREREIEVSFFGKSSSVLYDTSREKIQRGAKGAKGTVRYGTVRYKKVRVKLIPLETIKLILFFGRRPTREKKTG